MAIRIISDLAELKSIEGAYEALFRSCGRPHIKSSFPFVFADAATGTPGAWRCIAAYQDGALAGCLYGRREYRKVMRLSLPVFEIHADPLLAEQDGDRVLERLIGALQVEQQDCLYVVFRSLGPAGFDALERCLRRMNSRYAWQWAGYGFHIDTAVSEEAFLKGLDGKKRREIDRRARRLGTERVVEYVCDEDSNPELNARRYEEFLALEDSGWKGGNQSSLRHRAALGRFYRELVASASRAGLSVWHTLRIDGRPAAMGLCLRSHGTLWWPKVAYDEAHARNCPGILLTHHLLKWCVARSDIHEMNGISGAAWMETWNPRKTHYRYLNLFNDTLKSQLAGHALRMRSAGQDWRRDRDAPPTGYDKPCL
ncbi:MAG: GNAT family N-acetyltransferase [Gammaproteobacteria bacterium]|nr:GNAT family N-acetyltransferase [Gammaproteobacteria bacterium]